MYYMFSQNLLRNKDLEINSLNQKLLQQQHTNDKQLAALAEDSLRNIDLARADAVKRSKAVITGVVKENAAPFLIPNADPKDYRHLGGVVDYIVFDGLTAFREGSETPIVIKFLEIKTNTASLTREQKAVRAAIEAKAVVFETYKIGD